MGRQIYLGGRFLIYMCGLPKLSLCVGNAGIKAEWLNVFFFIAWNLNFISHQNVKHFLKGMMIIAGMCQ